MCQPSWLDREASRAPRQQKIERADDGSTECGCAPRVLEHGSPPRMLLKVFGEIVHLPIENEPNVLLRADTTGCQNRSCGAQHARRRA